MRQSAADRNAKVRLCSMGEGQGGSGRLGATDTSGHVSPIISLAAGKPARPSANITARTMACATASAA